MLLVQRSNFLAEFTTERGNSVVLICLSNDFLNIFGRDTAERDQCGRVRVDALFYQDLVQTLHFTLNEESHQSWVHNIS